VHLRNRAGIPGRQEVIAYNEVVEGQNVLRTEGTFLANCRSMVSVLTTTKLLSMWYVLIVLLGDRRVPGRRVQLMHKVIRLTMQRLSANANTKRAAATRRRAASGLIFTRYPPCLWLVCRICIIR